MKSNDGDFLFRTRANCSGRGWLPVRSKQDLTGRFGALPWSTSVDAVMKAVLAFCYGYKPCEPAIRFAAF